MGFLDNFKRMGNNCLKTHARINKNQVDQPKVNNRSGCRGHKRLGSTSSTVSGDDIKLVWANSKDSNTWFDQLGAKDIFPRFNIFLENWKIWQDLERQCKEMLGFDLEKQLVESLCIIPSGMRVGLGYGCKTEEYDFYLDVDPLIQLNELSGYLSCTLQKAIELFKTLSREMKTLTEQGEKICYDLAKILGHLQEVRASGFDLSGQCFDNPEQLKQALALVKNVVTTLKSYSATITDYILQQGHNVDIVVSNKKSSNPKLIVYPKKTITKIKVKEIDEKTFVMLNKGEDDEKYIDISFK